MCSRRLVNVGNRRNVKLNENCLMCARRGVYTNTHTMYLVSESMDSGREVISLSKFRYCNVFGSETPRAPQYFALSVDFVQIRSKDEFAFSALFSI